MCHSRMSSNAFVIKSIRLFDFFIGNFFCRFMSNRKVLQALNVVQLSSVKFCGKMQAIDVMSKKKQFKECDKELFLKLTDDTIFVEFYRKTKRAIDLKKTVFRSEQFLKINYLNLRTSVSYLKTWQPSLKLQFVLFQNGLQSDISLSTKIVASALLKDSTNNWKNQW